MTELNSVTSAKPCFPNKLYIHSFRGLGCGYICWGATTQPPSGSIYQLHLPGASYVPFSRLGTLHVLAGLILTSTLWTWGRDHYLPHSQRRKQREREVEWPSQGCSTSEQKSWNSEAEAPGNSLVVQSLGLCPLIAEPLGSIPGWGTKIQVAGPGQNKKFF